MPIGSDSTIEAYIIKGVKMFQINESGNYLFELDNNILGIGGFGGKRYFKWCDLNTLQYIKNYNNSRDVLFKNSYCYQYFENRYYFSKEIQFMYYNVINLL